MRTKDFAVAVLGVLAARALVSTGPQTPLNGRTPLQDDGDRVWFRDIRIRRLR